MLVAVIMVTVTMMRMKILKRIYIIYLTLALSMFEFSVKQKGPLSSQQSWSCLHIRSLFPTHSLEQLDPFSPMVSACIPLSGAGARGIWETWDAIFSVCSLHSNAVTVTKWVYAQCRRKVYTYSCSRSIFAQKSLWGFIFMGILTSTSQSNCQQNLQD